jgi:Holliday junction resolvase RusA-like endonuclease
LGRDVVRKPAGATPQDLRGLYEEQTGLAWSVDEGVKWLNQNYERLDIFMKSPVLDKSAHITLSDKASWLSQQRCHVCHSGFPISVTPFRIRPESWQVLGSVDKRAFKATMAHRLSESPHIERLEGRVCLTLVFVCSARRRSRDLDNMAKLFVDSIKERMMGDDGEVDHLNLMRLAHEEDEEYVLVRIAVSNLNDHDDVVDPRIRHSWAGAEVLDLDDFKT